MSNTPSPSEPQGSTITIPAGTNAPGVAPVPGQAGNGVMVGDVQQPAIVTRQATPAGQAVQQAIESPQGFAGLSEHERALVERARAEEREKLYGKVAKVDELETQLQTLTQEREARLAEEERLRQEAAAAAEQARLDEMDLRTRLETMDATWQQRFAEERAERERAEAMVDQERRLSQLAAYRQQKLAEAEGQFIPQLATFVVGNTPEEIDASVAAVIQQSASVIQDVQQTAALQRQQMPGVSPTGMPAGMGPMEQGATTQSFSAEQIRAMTPAQYAQHQAQLRVAARQQFYGQ